MNWTALYTPNFSGAMNMAIDQYFLNEVESGRMGPVVRFYTWSPYCFSLGNAQKAEQELLLKKVKADGFQVVKRMTGGRVVFHAEELTYSFILPLNQADWTQSLSSTYQRINEILAEGFLDLGFDLRLERGESKDGFVKTVANKPCFASTSRSELVFEGRKVVGSAQRRLRNSAIQHGSILLKEKHLDVGDYLNIPDPTSHKMSLKNNSAVLSEMGELPGEEKMVEALRKAFENHAEHELPLRDLITLERKESESLAPKFHLY